jgi:uncharacterized protein
MPFDNLSVSKYLRSASSGKAVVVYHSLLGNLRFADDDILEFLRMIERGANLDELNIQFPEVNIEEEILKLEGLFFLVPPGGDEKVLRWTQRLDRPYQRGELVRGLRLNVTTECNLACSYCYGVNGEKEKPQREYMTLETAYRALHLYVDLIKENGIKQLQVRYFGGEPLLNWPTVKANIQELVAITEKDGFQLIIDLNTNAILINQEIANELKKFSQYLHLIVSLDGPAKAHNSARFFKNGKGSFDAVVRGIDILQKANVPVAISTALGSHNLSELPMLVDLLVDKDLKSVGINPIIIVEENVQNPVIEKMLEVIEYGESKGFHVSGLWDRVIERLDHGVTGSFCGAMGSELSILPNGDIYPCQAQPFRLGTLEDLETRSIFATDMYKKIALRVAGNLPECQGCEIEGLCGGGCAADAFTVKCDLYGRTQHCDFMKAMVSQYLRHLLEDKLTLLQSIE